MIGMKTVCFFISPLQLKVNCLLLTLCCLDLQQLHCFRRYGALVVTTSYDVQVPEHVGTFTWVDSQSGHLTVIFLLSLLHWGSTSPTRGSPLTRSSSSEVNRTASNSVPSFFSMVGDPVEVYGTIVHFPRVDVGKAHTLAWLRLHLHNSPQLRRALAFSSYIRLAEWCTPLFIHSHDYVRSNNRKSEYIGTFGICIAIHESWIQKYNWLFVYTAINVPCTYVHAQEICILDAGSTALLSCIILCQ